MSNYEFDVLVRGKPITKYRHEQNLYIEGRPGSEFIIRIKNNTARRILAIISVDGLSVMDGKEASYESGGYVIDPFDSLKIPGWRLDDESVAKFRFAHKKKSYAQKGGKPGNIGVIGCAVFEEELGYTMTFTANYFHPQVVYNSTTLVNGSEPNNPQGSSTCGVMSCDSTPSETSFQFHETTVDANSGPPTSTTITCDSLTTDQESSKVEAVQNIGTEFGKMSSHKVNEVEFTPKDKPASVFSIHYDDRAGLKARGIDLSRKAKVANPFPAQKRGCTPPEGWRG
jgi:hypothetical protein